MRKTNHSIHLTYYVFLIFILASCTKTKSNIHLPALFSDSMVLQQNTAVALWGTATPNTKMEIKGSWGISEKAVADATGNWKVSLQTPKAGGPFELQISAADTSIILKDVLIGEVWLCSGQSNMEMPLKGWPPNDLIANSQQEIQNANYPKIRMFTVQKAIEPQPVTDFVGSWEVSSPATAGDFSAAAYFFGRELYESLNVPIGLIHSSWGGTVAEAWTEGKHLSSITGFEDILAKRENVILQQNTLNKWLEEKEVLDNSQLPEEMRWLDMDFKDEALIVTNTFSDWPQMQMPMLWEQGDMKGFDGVILFKKEVIIPDEFIGKEAVLELGPIDDMDETYINGQLVGKMLGDGFWNIDRVYNIPKDLLKKGKNILTIRIIDIRGGGGFGGTASTFKIYSKGAKEQEVSLSGDWSYLPLAQYKGDEFYLYGSNLTAYRERPIVDITFNPNTPTVLYNAMIAPLVPYTIKGAVWYQGESNRSRAKQYETLFPKMIESWRTIWNQGDFPFYFTQIAPFNYSAPEDILSGQLKDAQRKSLTVPNTGMIVTMDIGNVDNIHPANKQDVGKRLALWALAKDYGKMDAVFSGPLFNEMVIEENKARISFYYADNGLSIKETELKGFEIMGENGEFLIAKAVIDGNEVIVSHPKISKPKQVRYAFKNASIATLFNTEGLPASSFSTEE